MPKSTIQICLVGALLLATLFGCSNQSSSETNVVFNPSDETKPPLPELISDTDSRFFPTICELMDNPMPYDGKQIRVKTTFVRIGSEQWFGDEACVTRHPIFDAVFESNLEDLICSDKTHFSDNICKVATPSETNIDIAITAVFSGRFEIFQSDGKFSKDGHRFRLKVDSLANITDIQNVKKELVK